jgi:DNA replication protein DnaC
MNPSTVEQLKALRLTGMLAAWQEQQISGVYHDLSFDERLSLLVEREHHRRFEQKLQRRIKQAQLTTRAGITDIDFTIGRSLVKSKFLELAEGQWIKNHHHLIIVGPTGVGKTFLASVLAEHSCQIGFTARYFKCSDLMMELKLAKVDGSLRQLRRQLASFNLLILDDWLRDPLSSSEAREVLDVLDERYRRASCLFATQLPVQQWHQYVEDPTLADAILDRIVHDALRLNLNGESMRKLTSPLSVQSIAAE